MDWVVGVLSWVGTAGGRCLACQQAPGAGDFTMLCAPCNRERLAHGGHGVKGWILRAELIRKGTLPPD